MAKSKIPINLKDIENASLNLSQVISNTPLHRSNRLSNRYDADVYFKREDLQPVRSYKIRGAFNAISSLTESQIKKGVICASAGNHAQGVALSASKLKIKAVIVMPRNTPRQKVSRVKILGGKYVTVILFGDTFDESFKEALSIQKQKSLTFIHPFDDLKVITGQATVVKDIVEKIPDFDVIVVPIGGGGLISGVSCFLKLINHKAKIIGVEPSGAPSMFESLNKKKIVTLDKIDKFVDGAAVKTPGKNTFDIVKKLVDKVVLVPEGKVCEEMIELYQNRGIVAEPAGALSPASLEFIKKDIRGKKVICIISGGNNDLLRYEEILERSLIYKDLKHYFLINFSQRPGRLKVFVNDVLPENTDITHFQYVKKNNKESGLVFIGIELAKKDDLKLFMKNLTKNNFDFEKVDQNNSLFKFII